MRKNIYLSICAVILLFSNAYTQVKNEQFEQFAGKWEGIYEAGGDKNKEVLENKFIHKNMFFEMFVSGQMVDNSSNKYTSSVVFTVNENEAIVGWGFDEDGYKGIVEYKGTISGNKVILKGKSKDYTVEITYEIYSDKLTRISKWIFKDSPDKPSIVKCTYKRI
jgi:hypothetical protein